MPQTEFAFIDVAAETEIPEGTMKGFDVGPERVLVARVRGRLCAVGGLCTHQIAHLEDGVLEDNRVLCPRHGAALRPAHGRAADATGGHAGRGARGRGGRRTGAGQATPLPGFMIPLGSSAALIRCISAISTGLL